MYREKPAITDLSDPAPSKPLLSVIIPTYNESRNIVGILNSVGESLPSSVPSEIIIVDDDSPDGTGEIVRQFINDAKNNLHQNSGKGAVFSVKLISRSAKSGLSSAILEGVQASCGKFILVMDSDFSHPPQTIPVMIEQLQNDECDIVVASRYVKGGSVIGWPFKRRVMSKGATGIARHGLGIKIRDPMSGFFAFKRHIISDVKFDAIGYKMLLEILVKTKGAAVKEVPYAFTDRKSGSSKLDAAVMIDYVRAVWRLYRYGKSQRAKEERTSVRFISKAGRFYTVGASGLLVNYLVSLLFSSSLPDLWFLHASVFGIVASMVSNFFLNKLWTFEDRDFSRMKTFIQLGLFLGFSTFGALVQLGMLYVLFDTYDMFYPLALVLAVASGAVGNFVLNKKWTFRERIWS